MKMRRRVCFCHVYGILPHLEEIMFLWTFYLDSAKNAQKVIHSNLNLKVVLAILMAWTVMLASSTCGQILDVIDKQKNRLVLEAPTRFLDIKTHLWPPHLRVSHVVWTAQRFRRLWKSCNLNMELVWRSSASIWWNFWEIWERYLRSPEGTSSRLWWSGDFSCGTNIRLTSMILDLTDNH